MTIAGHRCRLCSANDREALVEEIAGTMWESRRDGVMVARSWADAGDYWQKPFREMALAVVEGLGGPSIVDSAASTLT